MFFCGSRFLIGPRLPPGAGREGAQAFWPAHKQQGLPALFHSYPGGAAGVLHEGPRQRSLPHHDSAAEQVRVRHRCPEAPTV